MHTHVCVSVRRWTQPSVSQCESRQWGTQSLVLKEMRRMKGTSPNPNPVTYILCGHSASFDRARSSELAYRQTELAMSWFSFRIAGEICVCSLNRVLTMTLHNHLSNGLKTDHQCLSIILFYGYCTTITQYCRKMSLPNNV